MEQNIPFGLRFSLLHRAFKRKMDETLAEKELTGVQFHVLGTLVRMERAGEAEISQTDLEQKTHLSHATMADLIKRLEKKGFLLSEQRLSDRRFKIIRATEKTYALGQEIARAEEETMCWLCSGIEKEEIDALIRTTDRMLQNAYSEDGKGCD